MSGDDDSVRVDAIAIELDGQPVRVVVEDDTSRSELVDAFGARADHNPGQVAFKVTAPSGSTKFHVVLDRSGFVLGRTRSASESVGILRRHLEAFAPPPPDAVRFKLRALLDTAGRALLAGFPLYTEPAPVERRLSRAGVALLDRVNVDIVLDEAGAPRLAPSTSPALDTTPALGHAATPERPTPIGGVLLPGGAATWSSAQVVTLLAEATVGHTDREVRLAVAERIARLPVRMVDPESRKDRAAALRELAEPDPGVSR